MRTLETMWRDLIVAAAGVGMVAGCGIGGGASADFAFTDIICLPEQGGVVRVVEGQNVGCTFQVEGSAAGPVTLSCEDEDGRPLDCSEPSATSLAPFDATALPIEDGFFDMDTAGLGGTTAVVVWVADDGEQRVRQRISAEVLADDGIDDPTDIQIDCGGDTDGTVVANAGSELTCALTLSDTDPGNLAWSYVLSEGATPTNEAMPFGSVGASPLAITWRWMTANGEAGMTWVYTFSVTDGLGNNTSRDLTVSVQ